MAVCTRVKDVCNLLLRLANLQLSTLTASRLEESRLCSLQRGGYFTQPQFPVPPSFESSAYRGIVDGLGRHQWRFSTFTDTTKNDVGYHFDNQWFSSPDTEVTYAIVHRLRPARILEVGSGYSTRVMRQAVIDAKSTTYIQSVDPSPRGNVAGIADEYLPLRFEDFVRRGGRETLRALGPGDVFFVDSSHELSCGNDVICALLQVLPTLPPGVVVHIHDVFLPFDYPAEWVVENRWSWNEQYLVQALLFGSLAYEVLWPGYYLQRTESDFSNHFIHGRNRRAQSLWLRKISQIAHFDQTAIAWKPSETTTTLSPVAL